MKKKFCLSLAIVLLFFSAAILPAHAAAGKCGDNLTYSYEDSGKTVVITGTGEMDDYSICVFGPTTLEKVVIGEGVTSVGSYAFYDCQKLRSISLPSTLTKIGAGAFTLSSATTVELPESLTDIDEGAFWGMRALSLTIPKNVSSIGDSAFCNVKSVSVDPSNSHFILKGGMVLSADGKRLLCFSSALNSSSTIDVPDGVTTIGSYAFGYNETIQTVHLPSSVSEIGESAFSNSSLQHISIPSGLKKLGKFAFWFSKLQTLDLSDTTLERIGWSSVDSCSDLTSVALPKTLTHLDMQFDGTQITSLVIPDNVYSLGRESARDCIKLTEITFGPKITYIHENAFPFCQNLKKIRGYSGTAAEKFAADNGYTFESLGAAHAGSLKNFSARRSYRAGQFRDVPSSLWCANTIQTVYQAGLMDGVSKTAFAPGDRVNLSNLIVMAARLHSIYTGDGHVFGRISGKPWYQSYVDYAIKEGLFSAGDFSSYDVTANQGQMAYLFAHTLSYGALPTLNHLPNAIIGNNDIQNMYCGTEVDALYCAGVLTGSNSERSFSSYPSVTRAQAAAVMARLIDPSLRVKF